MNASWSDLMHQDWYYPWIFMATPSLHTDVSGTCPPGGQILELATAANYEYFRRVRFEGEAAYERKKQELRDALLEIVEQNYIPGLRDHIALRVTGSPITNEEFCRAPRGHSYGQPLEPAYLVRGRLGFETPWSNFYWCNAASGYPGIYGTVGAGMRLYERLTGESLSHRQAKARPS